LTARHTDGPEASLLRVIKRTLLWAGAVLAGIALTYAAVLTWPDPLFVFSAGTGKIVVASDRPIPLAGGARFLQGCERLLARSPLKAGDHQYHVYVTNEDWRRRLFFLAHPQAWGLTYTIGLRGTSFLSGANFETGQVVHWGYVGTPPRTLAWLCAHEVTHIIEWEHVGLRRFFVPRWAWEGFAEYVGIENRETFDELWGALGDRPDDTPTIIKYGSYPRYRLLVTFFIEKKGWSVDQLLQTRLTEDEAMKIVRAGAQR
jgi:hypothetical protein